MRTNGSQTISSTPAGTRTASKAAAVSQATTAFLQHLVDGISALPDIINTNVLSPGQVTGKTKSTDGGVIAFPVDLHWEFTSQDKDHKAIVHARDWAQPVTMQSVLAMSSLLKEVPKQFVGVIVTMRGIEKTALEYARAKGIKICLLRPLTQDQLKTSESTSFVRFKGLVPRLSGVQLKLDPTDNQSLTTEEQQQISSVESNRLFLYSESGTQIGSLADLCSALVPKGIERTSEHQIERTFKEPVFIHMDDSTRHVKLSGVSATVTLEEFESGLGQLEIAAQLRDSIIS